MAAAYGSIANTATDLRTNTTISVPSGTANGDLLVLFCATANNHGSGGAAAMTVPAGFTQVGTDALCEAGAGSSDWQGRSIVAVRVASSEPSNYTVNHSSCYSAGTIIRLTGSGTLSVDVSSQASSASGGSDPVTATSVTPTLSNDLLVFLGLNWNEGGSTPPSGMTERLDNTLVYVATQALASSSATGTRSVTYGSSAPWTAVLLAVKDVVGGGSPVSAIGTAGAISVKGQTGIVAVTSSVSVAATAGKIYVRGQTGILGASNLVSVTAVAGEIEVKGSTGVAKVAFDTKLVATAGGLGISGGGLSLSVANPQTIIASPGAIKILGAVGIAAVTTGMAIQAAEGHLRAVGQALSLTLSANVLVTADTGKVYVRGGVGSVLVADGKFIPAVSGTVHVKGFVGEVATSDVEVIEAVPGLVHVTGQVGVVDIVADINPEIYPEAAGSIQIVGQTGRAHAPGTAFWVTIEADIKIWRTKLE